MLLRRHCSRQEQDERFYDPLVTQDKEKEILFPTGTLGVAINTSTVSLHKHVKDPKGP